MTQVEQEPGLVCCGGGALFVVATGGCKVTIKTFFFLKNCPAFDFFNFVYCSDLIALIMKLLFYLKHGEALAAAPDYVNVVFKLMMIYYWHSFMCDLNSVILRSV